MRFAFCMLLGLILATTFDRYGEVALGMFILGVACGAIFLQPSVPEYYKETIYKPVDKDQP